MSISIWKYYERDNIIDQFLYKRKNPYYWGAINAEECKSANNKNCYMAMCRAAKNKTRLFRVLKIKQYIIDLHLT